VERLHRRIKDALRARAAHSNWHQHLPWIMLGLRAAPRENSGISAAELVYGAPLQLPGQLLSAAQPPPEDFVKRINSGVPCVAQLQSPPQQQSAVVSQLQRAAFVYVKSPPAAPALSPAYRGPYAVHKRADNFFIIKMGQRFEAVALIWARPRALRIRLAEGGLAAAGTTSSSAGMPPPLGGSTVKGQKSHATVPLKLHTLA
jgi:hypothetical protein